MVLTRSATLEDVSFLPDVERSAAARFAAWPGLEWIASDDVQSEAVHRALIETGLALVAEGQGREPIAFLNGELAGDELHIRQIAVRREEQGQGVGRQLVDAALLKAREWELRAATLTTFRDVAWNEPW